MLLFDLLYVLFLLVSLPFWLKYLYKKHYREILAHRLRPNIARANGKERVWVHAVSVGEVRSLKNFIPQLQENYPDDDIVLSATTPAGYDCAVEMYGDDERVTVINAPIDFSFIVRRFLKTINPRVLILNELEIWPNWVRLTFRKRIPIVLINGRISEVAFARYRRFRFLVGSFFKKIGLYLVQADLYKERFRELGIPAEKIMVCGNIKSDAAYDTMSRLPSEQDIWSHLGRENGETRGNKKILVVASSHRSDEEVVIPAISQFREQYDVIIVPRHLTRVNEIETMLKTHGIGFETFSKYSDSECTNSKCFHSRGSHNKDSQGGKPGTDSGRSPVPVLIYDRMGYLFSLLKIADIVFMGGTMERKIGGHNLYEPAVLGKPIIGGPFYNNFPDVGPELVDNDVYVVVETTEQLMEALKHWDHGEGTNNSLADAAVQSVARRRGSIKCILKEIRSLID